VQFHPTPLLHESRSAFLYPETVGDTIGLLLGLWATAGDLLRTYLNQDQHRDRTSDASENIIYSSTKGGKTAEERLISASH
jgi:hypothetical protein